MSVQGETCIQSFRESGSPAFDCYKSVFGRCGLRSQSEAKEAFSANRESMVKDPRPP